MTIDKRLMDHQSPEKIRESVNMSAIETAKATDVDNRQLKKRKSEENDKLRCEYVMIQKNRRCGMQVKHGQKLCPQHLGAGTGAGAGQERVPCPIDPCHTIPRDNLLKHIKKCGSLRKEKREPWYTQDLNTKLRDESEKGVKTEVEPTEESTETMTEQEEIRKYIAHIRTFKDVFEPLKFQVESHTGLDKRISEVEHQKHPIQQSSLVGNLKARGQLGVDNFYVEFGCGKAELSRFLNFCMLKEVSEQEESDKESQNYGFGFIDRGINRMKNDPKIIKETAQFNTENQRSIEVQIKRSRIDIKDLDLTKFLESCHYQKVIGISKHLCGVATDLTLKLIFNSDLIQSNKFQGILIAMCCRHICDYDQLLPQSQTYLNERGITRESFKILKRFVSWAVSGTTSNEVTSTDNLTGITAEERREIGLISRRLIDESRVYAIKQFLPSNFKCEIFWYAKPEITLENVCLSITKT